jgi:DNA gyrase subunit B
MYVGGTDSYGLFVILRELLDNAADEYLAGRNEYLGVFVQDGAYWVQDGGAGVPQGVKSVEVTVNGKAVVSKMDTMQAVFGVLHTSGKFQSEAYKVSIGSHGVGVKGTNATSLYFKVWTCYKGSWFSVAFEKGKLTEKVAPAKAPKSPLTGKTMTKGTLVTFKPDPSIFSAKSFPPSMLTEWAEVMSYLSPGFKIQLKSSKGEKVFLSQKGPKDYTDARLKALKAESEPTVFEFSNELAVVALAFSNADGCEVRGFTNGLNNSQGGKHVDSVVAGMFKALKPYAGARQSFTVHDFKDGLVGLVNAKLHKAQFSSQDKAKLSDDRMGADFEASVLAAAEKFFKANKAMAGRLCERASKIADLKNKFKNNKKVAMALGKLKRSGLPPNYAPAHRTVPAKDRELILVEGASAAGPIREVRGKHQALLPLRGKILNVAKTKAERALQSQDILNILAAMGFDPKAEDPLSKLQVGRVICLADPDPDGHHINCLLLTLFTKYLPGMFDRGMVYVADTPEFYALHKGKVFTGDRLSIVHKKLKDAGVKADIHHVKGWGEVDSQVVKLWAVDSVTRRLIKINPLATSDTEQFGKLMGASMEVENEA